MEVMRMQMYWLSERLRVLHVLGLENTKEFEETKKELLILNEKYQKGQKRYKEYLKNL